MNIIFVMPSLKTGGGNRVFIELANVLSEKHRISILYPNNGGEKHTFIERTEISFLKIGNLAINKVHKLWNIFKCILYINSHLKEEIIIISDPLFCLLLFIIHNKKRVFRFVQADDYRIYDDGCILGKGLTLTVYKKLCLWAYHLKLHYIFNSRFVYDQYCRDSKRYNVPFHIVHPAINHFIFNPGKGKYIRNDSGLIISLVARKHPCKGLETFLNCYRELSEEYKNKVSQIYLISHDDLSGFDLVNMKIVKPQSDMDIADIYACSDIFISTSWWEGFGLPPLEAMACGCAVIISKSGGVDEFAVSGYNCLMFEPKSEKGLLTQMKLLIDSKELRQKLATRGRITASKINWKNSSRHLENILRLYF